MNEIWKDIPNYEGLYQISNLGRVKGLNRIVNHSYSNYLTLKEKILKQNANSKGYFDVCLSNDGETKHFRINRLVAFAFIPNPENKPQANHINGVKADNRAANLEWCTSSENNRHAFDTGLNQPIKGSDKWNAILTDNEVIQIRDLYKSGNYYMNQIAKLFNISIPTISMIVNRKIWKHI